MHAAQWKNCRIFLKVKKVESSSLVRTKPAFYVKPVFVAYFQRARTGAKSQKSSLTFLGEIGRTLLGARPGSNLTMGAR